MRWIPHQRQEPGQEPLAANAHARDAIPRWPEQGAGHHLSDAEADADEPQPLVGAAHVVREREQDRDRAPDHETRPRSR